MTIIQKQETIFLTNSKLLDSSRKLNNYSRSLTKESNYDEVIINDYEDSVKVIKIFNNVWKSNDASFQCCIGNLFYNNKDFKNSFIWYHKSAIQGYSQGQYNLAQMYERGEGTKKNYKKMMKWYRKAKNRGHDLARIRYQKIVDQNYENNTKLYDYESKQISLESSHNMKALNTFNNCKIRLKRKSFSKNKFSEVIKKCIIEYINTFKIGKENSNGLSKYKNFLKDKSKNILPGVPIFDINNKKDYEKIVRMSLYLLERNQNSDFENVIISSDKSGNGYLTIRNNSLDERIKDILLNITRDKLNFHNILYNILEKFYRNEEVLPKLIYVFSNRSLDEADIFKQSHTFCNHPFKNYSLEQVLDETTKIYNDGLVMPTIIFWNLSSQSEGASNIVVKRHKYLFEINGYSDKLVDSYLNGSLI